MEQTESFKLYQSRLGGIREEKEREGWECVGTDGCYKTVFSADARFVPEKYQSREDIITRWSYEGAYEVDLVPMYANSLYEDLLVKGEIQPEQIPDDKIIYVIYRRPKNPKS